MEFLKYDFLIESKSDVIPIYEMGTAQPVSFSVGRIQHTKTVVFSNEARITIYDEGSIVYKDQVYNNFNEMLRYLPKEIRLTIIYNLDEFRRFF